MEELFKNAAAIIEASAKNPLAIAALIILVCGFVSVILFWKEEKANIKLVAFAMLFIGLIGFGGAILYAEKSGKSAQVEPSATQSATPTNTPTPIPSLTPSPITASIASPNPAVNTTSKPTKIKTSPARDVAPKEKFYTISGQVLDETTKLPISGAVVSQVGKKGKAVTNKNGEYVLTIYSKSEEGFTVRAVKEGYRSGASLETNIYLRKN